MGTNCEACKGKHRLHTCKIVRRIARGRKRRSPLEAVENMLSFCAPGPRMSRTSCELCLAKDRKIAALELRLIDLLESDRKIAACDEKIKESDRKIAACDEKIAACDEELKQLEEQSDEEEEQSDEESDDEEEQSDEVR